MGLLLQDNCYSVLKQTNFFSFPLCLYFSDILNLVVNYDKHIEI